MSVLVIRRAHVPWTDLARNYRVLVDGQQRVLLGDDATVQIPVTPGEHVLRLQIDWCRSQDMAVNVMSWRNRALRSPRKGRTLVGIALHYWRDQYISLKTVNS